MVGVNPEVAHEQMAGLTGNGLPVVNAMLAFSSQARHPGLPLTPVVDLQLIRPHPHLYALADQPAAVAQAWEAGKLFHIDLNDQLQAGRFDQDLRFGSENLKSCFFLVRFLEGVGYQGPRHFDAHAVRTEGPEGVWDLFCRGVYAHLPHSQGKSTDP